jgi:hypothetical protein
MRKMHILINGFVASLGVVCLLSTAQAPAAELIPTPKAQEILGRLKPGHPRLLTDAAGFERLKQEIPKNPDLQRYFNRVQEDARGMLKQAPSQYQIPDGLRLLETSRRVMNRVYALAMMYRLQGDKEYAERAWQELEAAAGFKDWNPRHFLDTAEMTHAFAIGYDWLYDYWTPERRQVLVKAVAELGFKPALEIYRKNTGWTRARHNWNQVCNGGIGMGALAMGEVLPAECGEILEAALKSIQLPMAEYGPDGAWAEGPGYWNYATSYNVVFLAGLESALGTDFGLSQIPGFSEAGTFPIYATGPSGRAFNYADAGEGGIRSPSMFWLARKFNRPEYAWYQRQVAYGSAQDLLWYDGRGQKPTAASLPLDKYFRNAEVVTMRSDWEGREALWVGFKAGDNKANHSNLDLGSFVLEALGYRWAVDLGADNYNLPGYFGKQRWTYYRLRAEAHNTLVINPGEGPDQIPTAATKIVKFQSTPNRAVAVADLTPAYANAAQSVQRGMAMLERRRVLIQDEVKAAQPAAVWWFMTTPAQIRIEKDGRTAHLTQGKAELRAMLLSPAGAQFTVMDAVPLPTSPNPEGQRKNTGVRKLTIHLKDVTDLRLAVLLIPVSGEPAPQVIPSLVPLSQW